MPGQDSLSRAYVVRPLKSPAESPNYDPLKAKKRNSYRNRLFIDLSTTEPLPSGVKVSY